MIHKRRPRSDRMVLPFEQVACRVQWTKKGPRNNGPLYRTGCDVCGSPGRIRSAGEINRDIKKGIKSYCSNECSRDLSIIKECHTCKKEFTSSIKKGKRGRFCSKRCYSQWQTSPENKRENNPNWNPNGKHEPEHQLIRKSEEWAEWRRLVYTRDNYKCKFCGTSKDLHPHHIIPRRERPDLIYEVDNGISLCKPCHMQTVFQEHLFEERCFNLIGVPTEHYREQPQ